jgi:muramoyltetrapeptide carboxypeptidase
MNRPGPTIDPTRRRVLSASVALVIPFGIAPAIAWTSADEPGAPLVGASTWLKAPALKPGDLIAFVAPAGPTDMAPIRTVAADLELLGYRVRVPADLGRRSGEYLAGTDDERAAELNEALRDPAVRAVFPARGGFGLTRILDRLDYDALRRAPKIVTGFSDLTALHLAIARRCRLITFHGPMVADLARREPPHDFADRSFRRMVLGTRPSRPALPTSGPAAADRGDGGRERISMELPPGVRPTRMVGGKARGRLIGGNLSLIAATMGTPFAIETEGAILFLEDVHEAPYRVDRMLSQLRLAGAFRGLAGVVTGGFTNKDPADAPKIDRVLREYFRGLGVPAVTGFPIGHQPLNATLPHGALAEMDADAGTLTLLESPLGP